MLLRHATRFKPQPNSHAAGWPEFHKNLSLLSDWTFCADSCGLEAFGWRSQAMPTGFGACSIICHVVYKVTIAA